MRPNNCLQRVRIKIESKLFLSRFFFAIVEYCCTTYTKPVLLYGARYLPANCCRVIGLLINSIVD